MLPGINGFEVCAKAREAFPQLGVIILTAKGQEENKIEGPGGRRRRLHRQAVQPERIARAHQRALRLPLPQVDEAGEDAKEITTGIFTMNIDERRFLKNGKEIELTPIEFSLVKYFMENANKAVHRDEILNNVWGYNYVGDFKIVDVNIRRIRQKIEEDPSKPKYIEKVWGYGYRWWGGD